MAIFRTHTHPSSATFGRKLIGDKFIFEMTNFSSGRNQWTRRAGGERERKQLEACFHYYYCFFTHILKYETGNNYEWALNIISNYCDTLEHHSCRPASPRTESGKREDKVLFLLAHSIVARRSQFQKFYFCRPAEKKRKKETEEGKKLWPKKKDNISSFVLSVSK